MQKRFRSLGRLHRIAEKRNRISALEHKGRKITPCPREWKPVVSGYLQVDRFRVIDGVSDVSLAD